MGIAPSVNLVNMRVLDHTGAGKDSNVIAAIDQVISWQQQNPGTRHVINLSLGRGVYTSYKNDPLDQAVEAAWQAGIVVVVAAGNYGRDNSVGEHGYGTITVPGNDPYVITVGAMNTLGTMSRSDDVPASYSSKGPTMLDHVAKPDLVAPGNLITSTLGASASMPTLFPSLKVPYGQYKKNGGSSASSYYMTLSGTSMAAPVVSGAAAMLLQQNSSLTPDQIKARLMKTADKNLVEYSTATDPTTGITYSMQADLFTVGAGYLDINAALNNTDLASATTGVAMSPTVTYSTTSSGVTTVKLVTGSSVLWGNSVLWGTSVVWGTQALVNGSSVLWGNSVLWGSSTMQGFNVLWGSSTSSMSVLWGNSTTESDASSGLTTGDKL